MAKDVIEERDERTSVNIPSKMAGKAKLAAHFEGMTLSDFVSQAIEEKATPILKKQLKAKIQ